MRLMSFVSAAPYPADGVGDHAARLSEALGAVGVEADLTVVDWRRHGWRAAVRKVRERLRAKPDVTLVHYSHLAWSRRGGTARLLALVAMCRATSRVVLWVHDPGVQKGGGARRAVRGWAKGVGLRSAIRVAGRGVVTVDPSVIPWMRRSLLRCVVLCPSPSNIGFGVRTPPTDLFTVSCFGIDVASTDAEKGPLEQVCRALVALVGPFRLRLLGARSDTEPLPLAAGLSALGVVCDVPGALPADQLRAHLAASHAFVVLRRELSSRSGTLAAALACGLPVVGMRGPETAPPIFDAGVVFAARDDWRGFANELSALRDDPARQAELSARSSGAATRSLSWEVAARVVMELIDR